MSKIVAKRFLQFGIQIGASVAVPSVFWATALLLLPVLLLRVSAQ